MKKNLLLVYLCCLSTSLFAQNVLDASGNMSEKFESFVSVNSVKNVTSKSTSIASVVHAIPSPSTAPMDLAFDGENLWLSGYNNIVLYKLSPITGAVLKTIPTLIQHAYGLEFANGYLFVTDCIGKLIHKVDTANGAVIASFPTPSVFGSSYPTGLAWDGQNFWQNDPMSSTYNINDSTFNITSAGQLLQGNHSYGTYCSGLAWDGQYLWSNDNGSLQIFKIDVSTFTVVNTITVPGGQYPNGLTYDGQYLWLSNNATDSIYQIDIGNVSAGLSANAALNTDAYMIYPNPAHDAITVEFSNSDIGSAFSVLDELGREMQSGVVVEKSTKINIGNWGAGIYLFHVDNKKNQTFRVVKK